MLAQCSRRVLEISISFTKHNDHLRAQSRILIVGSLCLVNSFANVETLTNFHVEAARGFRKMTSRYSCRKAPVYKVLPFPFSANSRRPRWRVLTLGHST